ncbi:heat shock protein HspQ [Arsenophonus symbiont of Ornithomya chloropus]|uniref:heat shock protein HspQ n=1 Tax=Arsenophonus symbiont of Ornithomya chloropus TaxID=634121 RepID=UPI0032B1DC26
MITNSKFNIGQKIRHQLLGYLGVIVDVDAKYCLDIFKNKDIKYHTTLLEAPWYHVIMEDSNGEHIHTYLAEAQITYEIFDENLDDSSLDELSKSIKIQLENPQLRN